MAAAVAFAVAFHAVIDMPLQRLLNRKRSARAAQPATLTPGIA
jgi:peptidoglycan/LPS O-acetylase OafA/YrhL